MKILLIISAILLVKFELIIAQELQLELQYEINENQCNQCNGTDGINGITGTDLATEVSSDTSTTEILPDYEQGEDNLTTLGHISDDYTPEPSQSSRPSSSTTVKAVTLPHKDRYNSTTTRRPRPSKPKTTPSRSPPLPLPVQLCNADGKYNGAFGIDHWQPVYPGYKSYAECPNGAPNANINASWLCVDSGLFEPNGPDWALCNEWMDEINDMSEQNITCLENAIQVIESIANYTTRNNSIVESEKLSQVLDIVLRVQTFVDKVNQTDWDNIEIYAKHVVETFVHIMAQKYAWINTTEDEKTNIATKILRGTQSSVYSLSSKQNSNKSVVEIHNNDFYINTFFANSSHELTFPANLQNYSSIYVPPHTRFVNDTKVRDSIAFGVIIRHIVSYLSANLTEDQEINSDILAFSLTNISEKLELTNEVTITLRHKQRLRPGDAIDCVFWDFDGSHWSSEGCHKVEDESDLLQTVCRCNHLTNFAALMDIGGREEKTLVKTVLTYICSIVSILSLVFTVNLVIRSRLKQNEKGSDKSNLDEMRAIITTNLCICLLLTNVLVVSAMGRTEIQWLCQLSSALLLYSLLSSFLWMLLEGYYLYRSLVLVFNSEFKAIYLYLFGYGFPIAIIILAFLIIYIKENILLEALFDERYNYFCWIASSHYPNHIWILIGPALCVIFSNCVLMYISLKTAFKVLKNRSSFGQTSDKSRIKMKQIISFIFILFMLGITWLSFLFYIHSVYGYYFSYLFIVLNGSQGFFIFLYHLSIYDFNLVNKLKKLSEGFKKLMKHLNK